MTGPSTTTYDQLKKKQADLIRKALEGRPLDDLHSDELAAMPQPDTGNQRGTRERLSRNGSSRRVDSCRSAMAGTR
jgi:hypothetical protein